MKPLPTPSQSSVRLHQLCQALLPPSRKASVRWPHRFSPFGRAISIAVSLSSRLPSPRSRMRLARWLAHRLQPLALHKVKYPVVRFRRDSYAIHRVIAQVVLGAPLPRHLNIHHRDRQTHNFDPANLELLATEHHAAEHALKYPRVRSCPRCGSLFWCGDSRAFVCCSPFCGRRLYMLAGRRRRLARTIRATRAQCRAILSG